MRSNLCFSTQWNTKPEILTWSISGYTSTRAHTHTCDRIAPQIGSTAEHTPSPYCCSSWHGWARLFFASFSSPRVCSAAGSPHSPSVWAQSKQSWGHNHKDTIQLELTWQCFFISDLVKKTQMPEQCKEMLNVVHIQNKFHPHSSQVKSNLFVEHISCTKQFKVLYRNKSIAAGSRKSIKNM